MDLKHKQQPAANVSKIGSLFCVKVTAEKVTWTLRISISFPIQERQKLREMWAKISIMLENNDAERQAYVVTFPLFVM